MLNFVAKRRMILSSEIHRVRSCTTNMIAATGNSCRRDTSNLGWVFRKMNNDIDQSEFISQQIEYQDHKNFKCIHMR